MDRFKFPPLRRHAAFVPFSRDHYVGLVQARHLIEVPTDDVGQQRQVIAEFLDAWERDISVHFADEERLLLESMTTEDRKSLLEQHRQLAADAAGLRAMPADARPDVAHLVAIGHRLESHIRWEERELFPRLQSSMDERRLADLSTATDEIEGTRARKHAAIRSDDSGESTRHRR